MSTRKPHDTLTFEPMRLSDLQQVMAIENECFEDPWSTTYFALALKRPKTYEFFYVARHEKTVMGYIVFAIIHEEAQILNIAVPAVHRGRGIGKYLLASALDMIQRRGGNEVFLEVAVSNLPAQYLYRQLGFRIYGIRKNYYGRHKDAYLFRKGVDTDAT